MSFTSKPWTSTTPGAQGRTLTLLPLPVMKALRQGDLESAQGLSQLKLPSILISQLCRSTRQRRYAEIELKANDEPWLTRLVVKTDTETIVGRAGFISPPNETGMVEVGYAIDALHRRQGHARAALEILLETARFHPDVKTVRATIRLDNLPSRALVDQYGFREFGEKWDEENGVLTIMQLDIS